MPYKFNPLTGTFDIVSDLNQSTADARYLKLDQTGTPQTVSNGAPVFDSGIKSNGPIILKAGQKLIFDGA